ncbi:hypothetical protein [Halobacillus litoralis]|uniref:hypothetical protein n=1 Tax=Halobacillus litoralis TaxID=45668 RepID=UPI001CFE17A4|nr:hypothetical protein [Halobacillus litoralis]
MSRIFDFQGYVNKKKRLYTGDSHRSIDLEIYRSVVHHLQLSRIETYDEHIEVITTSTPLKLFYERDEQRFIHMFTSLLHQWNLIVEGEQEGLYERFPTVGDLCLYIKRRVKAL